MIGPGSSHILGEHFITKQHLQPRSAFLNSPPQHSLTTLHLMICGYRLLILIAVFCVRMRSPHPTRKGPDRNLDSLKRDVSFNPLDCQNNGPQRNENVPRKLTLGEEQGTSQRTTCLLKRFFLVQQLTRQPCRMGPNEAQ